MAFDSPVSVIAISLAFLPFLFLHSVADTTNATAPVSASTVCNSTLYPGFCKKVLQADNQTANVYEYGRFSVKKSLSAANKFLHLVNKYLSKRRKLTAAAVRALEDCQLLAQLNIDFLSTSFQTVNTTSKVLSSSQAEDIQTLLSGILTNQQTCLDGLKSVESAWTVKNGLAIPLANDTKLYSVSLAIVTKGWVPKKKKGSSPKSSHGRKLPGIRNGQLQLKMSEKTRRIFETFSRRNLQDDSSGSGDNGVMVSDIVTVSQDGSGDYTLINDAIASAPNNSNGTDGYFLIYVTAGVYPEYVSIAKNKKYLLMIGDGINQTIITGNRSYVDGWTTFSSATFAVVGTGFVAVNITIRNTAGAIKHQAVALRNGADWSTFYFCSFEGYQDTLYAYSLRQFYRQCDIYGTIDFIFGNAAVIFQNCNLYPRLPLQYQFNAITAQGRTDPGQTTGTSILNCTIKAADDLASSNGTTQTYLGRPWKQYSRTVYIESYMGSLINPAGWTEWNGTFALDTLYYGEFNNTGPGSNTTGRVTWPGYHIMNATDAANYTVSNFLLGDDWLPQTGVTYFDNLV